MNNHEDLPEILTHVDPAKCDYEEWLHVGLALHDSGLPFSVWDEWSRRDPARYHEGECERKWRGFHGSSKPVTSGTIVALARAQGYFPEGGHELGWEDTIGGDGEIVDMKWIQDETIDPPEHFDPVQELTAYLEALFNAEEYVGYCTEVWKKDDGRYLPTKGCYDRTAGELIEKLNHCGGDIGSVIGDPNPDAGAWIRFNPLDGQGVRDQNVTSYRYALVECDDMPVGRQYAIIKQLELPVAVLVHSGGKSLHAIVRIDALNYEEYRKRVDYLYGVCKKNGLTLDKQNRNPSRLSRMPGVTRGGKPQYIVARGIGQESFESWRERIESANDDLPDEDDLSLVLRALPPLAPPLIYGVLRQGHKLLLAGPSKAGKSFALIELCIAIAEGIPWLGFPCAQGSVLYVNLELDRASCLHRFADVYDALGIVDRHPEHIVVWNLRGKSVPMDKLAPKLIRRASKRAYAAIVIDPLYKVITGDENSADQMAAFCNQFDRVATELGCSVVYCHHHSKGVQGQKRSMDRASGSGVFARDPDAMIDMIGLPVSEALSKQQADAAECETRMKWLKRFCHDWAERASEDDACSAARMREIVREALPQAAQMRCDDEVRAARQRVLRRTAWRIEGTLREFEAFPPRDLWFDYPAHRVDVDGVLAGVDPESEALPFGGNRMRKKSAQQRRQERSDSLTFAFDAAQVDGKTTVAALAECLGVCQKTIRRRLMESPEYALNGGEVTRKDEKQGRSKPQ